MKREMASRRHSIYTSLVTKENVSDGESRSAKIRQKKPKTSVEQLEYHLRRLDIEECSSTNDLSSSEASYWLEDEVTVPPTAVTISIRWNKLLEESFLTTQTYPSFYDILDNCLDVSESPHWTFLHLLSSSPGYYVARTDQDCITLWLTDGFYEYVKTRLPTLPKLLSKDLKRAAFLVALRQKHDMINVMIASAFDLATNAEIYVPLIKKEIEMKRYDNVFDAVTLLELQTHFTPKDILPILLRDNFEGMEFYVDGNKIILQQLVSYLDTFCVAKSVAEPLLKDLNIPEDRKKWLKLGYLSKALGYFVKKYNIHRHYYPNLNRMLRHDAVYSSLEKKYVKFTRNDEDFDRIVRSSARDNKQLQWKLVYGMVRLGDDVIGAARYVVEFGLPLKNLPKDVKRAVERREYEMASPTKTMTPSKSTKTPLKESNYIIDNSQKESHERTKTGTGSRVTVQKETIRRPKASKRGNGKRRSKEKPQETPKSSWLEQRVNIPSIIIKQTKEWLKVFETSFKSRRDYSKFSDDLRNCFAKTDSIWWTILHLISSSPDYFKAKTTKDSITSFLARGFRDYLSRSSAKQRSKPWNDQKMAAFLVAFHQKHEIVFEIIFVSFDLYEDREMFLPLIEDEIREKSYDIVARAVTTLKLQSHFMPDKILFPLFLQERYDTVHSYLLDDKNQQREFVRFLDGFCLRKPSFELERLAKSFGMPKDQKDRLRSDAMIASVKRYVKKYDVPQMYWPNMKQMHDILTLRFVLRSKYEDRAITDENFDDFVVEIVGISDQLKVKLVCAMANYGDAKGAAGYAVRFELPLDRVPKNVKIAVANGDYVTQISSGGSFEVGQGDQQMSRYEPNAMIWKAIYHPNIFQTEIENILKSPKGTVVAIDCEWKPVLDFDSPQLSLLQVATNCKNNDDVLIVDIVNNVFVMDIMSMKSNLNDGHWSSFRNLLASSSVLKLGYKCNKDFVVYADASPKLKNVSEVTKNFLDMSVLCNRILDIRPDIFPFYDGTIPKSRSLESFVRLCFDRKSDKSQQISNWDRRPLKTSQLIYAATDAYCLLDMYQVLLTRAQEFGLDLFSFMSSTNNKKEK